MPPLTPETIKLFEGRAIDILIESYSNSTRILEVHGMSENQFISHDHTTSSDRTIVSSSISLTKMPVTLTVKTANTSVSKGECYVKVSLRVDRTIVASLLAGYITDTAPLIYPGGRIEDAIEGAGVQRSITGTNPGLGVEVSETVPTNVRWRLKSLRVQLVNDATVASRAVSLEITDGTNTVAKFGAANAQTAGTTWTYTFADVGTNIASISDQILIGIQSDLILLEGYTIKTSTNGLQAGDNFGAPQYVIEEWIQP